MAKGGAGASAPTTVGIGVGGKPPPGVVAPGPGAPTGNSMTGGGPPPAVPGAGFDKTAYAQLQQQVNKAQRLAAQGGPGSAAWAKQLPGLTAQLSAMKKNAPPGMFGMAGGGGGAYQDPALPAGVMSPAGMKFTPGGGNQNAFSPQAGTWSPDPNAGGGGGINPDMLRSMLASMMTRPQPGRWGSERGGGG